jgi:pantetheine-phosphate adenylyltransferase
MSPRAAVYPGTFDPVTDGHMDIIKRAAKVVDRLVVAVAVNVGKDPLLSLEERTEILSAEVNDLGTDISSRITVMPFDNLLVDFVYSVDATIIIRGLRAVSDFEYEFQMASMNGRLNPNIETIFLTASENHQFIASRFVKEIGRLGGDIGHFVSPRVKKRIDKQWST